MKYLCIDIVFINVQVDALPKKPEKHGFQLRTNNDEATDISSGSKDSSVSTAGML